MYITFFDQNERTHIGLFAQEAITHIANTQFLTYIVAETGVSSGQVMRLVLLNYNTLKKCYDFDQIYFESQS